MEARCGLHSFSPQGWVTVMLASQEGARGELVGSLPSHIARLIFFYHRHGHTSRQQLQRGGAEEQGGLSSRPSSLSDKDVSCSLPPASGVACRAPSAVMARRLPPPAHSRPPLLQIRPCRRSQLRRHGLLGGRRAEVGLLCVG